MTLEQYRKQLAAKLRSASSSGNVDDILRSAQSDLDGVALSSFEKRQFWSAIYDDLRISIKEQNHSATHDIVSYAQSAIAQALADLDK